MLPINLSQKAFAVGACAGDFNTSIPQRATSSSKPREKVLWRSWSRNLYSRSPGSASRSCCRVLWVIKNGLVSGLAGKRAAVRKARLRDQQTNTRTWSTCGASTGGWVREVRSASGPTRITPLQTSYTDDEDRPVAVYR